MANTPFLDLVKPAGTDKALVSVINSNSDKIDTGVSTLSDQIGQFQGIEIAASTDLNSLTTPGNYYSPSSTRSATLSNSPTSSNPFALSVYKVGTNIAQRAQYPSAAVFTRGKNGSTWSAWSRAATEDQIDTLNNAAALCTKAEIIGANSSATFTPARTIGLLIGEYGANNIMYTIFRASATNVSVGEIKTNGNITVTTNNGVITVANGSSNSWRVRMLEIG